MATRAGSELRATSNVLLAAACALWLAAQLLPAFADPWRPVPDRSEYGWYATALGWVAPLYLGAAGVLLFAGWSANVWFLGAVLARVAHRGPFGTLAAAALVTAVVGVLAVSATIHVAEIGPGSWLWLGAMALLTCSAAAGRRSPAG